MRWTEKLLKGTVEQKALPKAHIKSGAKVDIACFFVQLLLFTSLCFLCCPLHQKRYRCFHSVYAFAHKIGNVFIVIPYNGLSVFLSHIRISQSFEYPNHRPFTFLSFIFVSVSFSFSRLPFCLWFLWQDEISIYQCIFVCMHANRTHINTQKMCLVELWLWLCLCCICRIVVFFQHKDTNSTMIGHKSNKQKTVVVLLFKYVVCYKSNSECSDC